VLSQDEDLPIVVSSEEQSGRRRDDGEPGAGDKGQVGLELTGIQSHCRSLLSGFYFAFFEHMMQTGLTELMSAHHSQSSSHYIQCYVSPVVKNKSKKPTCQRMSMQFNTYLIQYIKTLNHKTLCNQYQWKFSKNYLYIYNLFNTHARLHIHTVPSFPRNEESNYKLTYPK
jgi:hypothetical protein